MFFALKYSHQELVLSTKGHGMGMHIFGIYNSESRVAFNFALLQKKKILGCFHQHPRKSLISLVWGGDWAGRVNRQGPAGAKTIGQGSVVCIQTSLEAERDQICL